jgi:hypothetical protein
MDLSRCPKRYFDAPLHVDRVSVAGQDYYILGDLHDPTSEDPLHILAAWAEDVEALRKLPARFSSLGPRDSSMRSVSPQCSSALRLARQALPLEQGGSDLHIWRIRKMSSALTTSPSWFVLAPDNVRQRGSEIDR